MWLKTGQRYNKVKRKEVNEGYPDSISRRDRFNCALKREWKAGNKKLLASRPKNVSNELTDHIPTHKSRSRNHIQTYKSIGGKRRIAVELLSGRRRSSPTDQWALSIYITWRNPTNGSEIVPCCQKFLLKEKKRQREKYLKGGQRERQREKKDRERSCGEHWTKKT